MKELIERLKQTKPLRAWDQYSSARGNLLAGGIAYVALFSLFPALAIGFTVFAWVLGDNVELQQQVVDYINNAFGDEIIGMRAGQGFVSVPQLVQGDDARDVLTTTGVIALAVLLFTGLGWIDGLRQGIRAVFGLARLPGPVVKKMLDVVVLLVLGLLVLASVVVSLTLSTASRQALDLLGIDSPMARVLVQVVIEVSSVAVDVALFLTFFRLLARVAVPVRALLSAAIIGAVGLQLLKWGSGLLMRQASGNAFLASVAIVIGLLLWLNLVGRLTLFSAAWAAVTARDLGIPIEGVDAAANEVPAGARDGAASRPVAVQPSTAQPSTMRPTYGARTADRVTLAAGAVLGGMTVAGMGLAGRAVRTAREALRRT